MDNFECGGYVFNSNFDSGNLAKVELVNLHEDTSACDQIISTEFNVHTRPDCAGTLWENQNRSWFFFSIHGGEPGNICKINVVNMNKQAKLYNQGMQPVFRVGEKGKWERVKDRTVHCMLGDQFCMSFLHKPSVNCAPKVRYFYAFTYPYTYGECQDQLDRYAELYQKSSLRVNYIIQRLLAPATQKSHAVPTVAADTETAALVANTDFTGRTPYPGTVGARLSRMSRCQLETEIYYHRELLIHSVEGRRIDLLTITSCDGIQLEREPRLPDLFPDTQTVRCNVFHGKPVIFVSSRVHPGETPASHVLNGFLKLLLDTQSLIGAALRKKYVFKVVPFLNPDGVFQGCYRSDTLGHNLNRVYLRPSLHTQPAIYAVRKLVRYYHFGMDVPEDGDDIGQTTGASLNEPKTNSDECFVVPAQPNIPVQLSDATGHLIVNPTDPGLCSDSSTAHSSDSEFVADARPISRAAMATVCASDSSNTTCPSTTESDRDLHNSLMNPCLENNNANDGLGVVVLAAPAETTTRKAPARVFHDELMPVIKPIVIAGAAGVHPKKPVWSKGDKLLQRHSVHQPHQHRTEAAVSARNARMARDAMMSDSSDTAANSSTSSSATATYQPLIGAKFRITKRRNTAGSSGPDRQNNNSKTVGFLDGCGMPNDTETATTTDALNDGNLFMYIDLHGHASKKGIFMYGNHLPTTDEAVECMLLPRLMSMNSPHFHFDSCVFSERNMYTAGKRDGLSKEGSGRVAMYKATGVIKCYTLEGNYNTGKYMNVLPPRGKEPSARKSNLPVPKYTPLIYEEVGRALGPSILDLTGSNPMSRLPNTDFKSVQGLRHALRFELERAHPRSLVFNSAAPLNKSAKRPKSSKAKSKLPSNTITTPASAVPKQQQQQQPQAPHTAAVAALKENKLTNRQAFASVALPLTALRVAPPPPTTERLKKACAAFMKPMPANLCGVLPEPGEAESYHAQRLREQRARLAADLAAVASTSKASGMSTAGGSVATSSTTAGTIGVVVVGKRKTLKVRPKVQPTVVGVTSVAVASGSGGATTATTMSKCKPLKRGYSCKDSLRLKRKKKKLPKSGGGGCDEGSASGSVSSASVSSSAAANIRLPRS